MASPPSRQRLQKLKRGDVVLVDFDDPEDLSRGSEAKYEHPAVVVSSNPFNAASKHPTVTVVPITGADKDRKPFSTEVLLKKGDGGLKKDSLAQPYLIRALDRYQRIVEVWKPLSADAMMEIGVLLFEHLGGLPGEDES